MQIFINSSIYTAALFGLDLYTQGLTGLLSAAVLTFCAACFIQMARTNASQ